MDPNVIVPAILDLLAHPTSIQAVALLALVVAGLVRGLRTETISKWLDGLPPTWIKRIPKWLLPYMALLIGFVLNFLNARLNAHKGWHDAFVAGLAGVVAGWIAIGGHETIFKWLAGLKPKPPEPPAVAALPDADVTPRISTPPSPPPAAA